MKGVIRLLRFWCFRSFLLIYCNFYGVLHAQDKYDPDPLREYEIRRIDTYFFESLSSSDSLLQSQEYFNDQGRRLSSRRLSDGKVKSEYRFHYSNDTLMIGTSTLSRGYLVNKSVIKNDKKGRPISVINYDRQQNKTGDKLKIRYNDKEGWSETKFYQDKQLVNTTRRDLNMSPRYRGIWISLHGGLFLKKPKSLDDPNWLLDQFCESTIPLMICTKEVIIMDESVNVISIRGLVAVDIGDQIELERYYDSKGLLRYIRQSINGHSIGIQSLHYFKE